MGVMYSRAQSKWGAPKFFYQFLLRLVSAYHVINARTKDDMYPMANLLEI